MAGIVFLQLELSGYFMACLHAYTKLTDNQVHVVRLPINSEAPFELEVPKNVTLYNRHDYNEDQLIELIEELSPAVILCSGWVDKTYLKISRIHRDKGITTVMSLDNHWNGGLKQRILQVISRFWLRRIFNKLWVPGAPQVHYAHKLGFNDNNIETGYYCCDSDLFNKYYDQTITTKSTEYPRRFLYVGRYVDYKGVWDLWNAFKKLRQENDEWELWCAGTGDLVDQAPQIEGLRHWGFVQPAAMIDLIQSCGVYVLPSHKEPWAVTVHENSIAGMPVICSDQVGAATQFINEPVDGCVYAAGNEVALYEKMKFFTTRTDEQLLNMAKSAHQTGAELTTQIWAQKLKSFHS